ncbi:unnamed protein product [Alopecurus aequalis]
MCSVVGLKRIDGTSTGRHAVGRPAGMDDSSMFMQWAMETLQHEQPPAAAHYAILQELLQNGTATAGAAAAPEDRATHSWGSGDGGRNNTPGGAVVENDGWPSSYPPVTWSFASTMAQLTIPAAPARPAGVPELEPAHRSPEPCVQDHVIAERKRREKMNRSMIELSTVIPGLNKMDKATILSAAVRYVKEQQEKIKELEGRNLRSVDSVLLLKRPDGTATTGGSLPEIQVRISERNVIVTIHCKDGKGVLVRLLAELEGLHLSITHTNVIPFPACTMNITITAKVDEGSNIAPEDIVGKLEAALQ